MRRGAPTWLKRAVGFGSLAGAGLVAVLSFVPPQLPLHHSAHLKIEIASFGEMNPEARVELGGVRVGTVDSIDRRNGLTVLAVSVDPQYVDRIHADATAEVKPTGLLGPKFVSIGSGRTGRIRDGDTIPISRTHVSTDFDQVLEALQPDVRSSLKTVFVELGTASAGRGQDVNDAIRSLHDAEADLTATTATLANRNSEITTFFTQSEVFNRDQQFAPNAKNIADTDRVLKALVAVDGELGDGIDHTASVLDELNRALAGGGSANLATVLAKAPTTLAKANRLLDNATPVVQGVTPNLPDLLTAAAEGKKVVSGSDANGHYVRVLFLSGACTLPVGLPVTLPPNLQCSSPPGGVGGLLPSPLPSILPSGLPSPLGQPPSGQPADSGSTPDATPQSHSQLTDQQLIELFLK